MQSFGVWVAAGGALGALFCAAADDIALGAAFCFALGVAAGAAQIARVKNEKREKKAESKKDKESRSPEE